MQIPRQRNRLGRIAYVAGALAAVGGGALLAHLTEGARSPLSGMQVRPSWPSPSPAISASPIASPGLQEPRTDTRGVRVEILNGCGETGVMEPFVRRLRAEGYDVIKTANARSFGYVETMVIDRTGKRGDAVEIARILGVRPVIQQVKEDPFRLEDVTLVIGRDHRKLGL